MLAGGFGANLLVEHDGASARLNAELLFKGRRAADILSKGRHTVTGPRIEPHHAAVRAFTGAVVAEDRLTVGDPALEQALGLAIRHQFVLCGEVHFAETFALEQAPVRAQPFEQVTLTGLDHGLQPSGCIGVEILSGYASHAGGHGFEGGDIKPDITGGVDRHPVWLDDEDVSVTRLDSVLERSLQLPQYLAKLFFRLGRWIVAPQHGREVLS